jgi:hypothetical protein
MRRGCASTRPLEFGGEEYELVDTSALGGNGGGVSIGSGNLSVGKRGAAAAQKVAGLITRGVSLPARRVSAGHSNLPPVWPSPNWDAGRVHEMRQIAIYPFERNLRKQKLHVEPDRDFVSGSLD